MSAPEQTDDTVLAQTVGGTEAAEIVESLRMLTQANDKMRDCVNAVNSVHSTAPLKLPGDTVSYLGDETIVPYRPFADMESWVKQRLLGKDARTRNTMLAKWIIGPLAILAVLLALLFISWFTSLVASTAAAQHIDGNMNLIVIINFIFFLVNAAVFGAFYYQTKPTHVCFSPRGIRFLWRRKLMTVDGTIRPWASISQISISRKPESMSPRDYVLRFDSNHARKPLSIALKSIDSVIAQEAVLKAIERFASDVPRDALVTQALQPPADYSYTELWLQALSAPPKRERLKPLMEGATLRDGRYSVSGTLGVGGQGQAYLATDVAEGATVVLKEFILPVYVDVSVRRSALESFQNEAKILREIEHPQIVELKDFFVEDHRAYLVLEHIDGSSLRQIVQKDGALPDEQVKALAKQMCNILSYLHSLSPPVVHRDFTPDNLILNKDGQLKLIDFNVAKQIESTTVGTVVGKHNYLPPEQFRGQPVPQSDIYAFGATIYYLLTGQDPEPITCSQPKTIKPNVDESLNAIARGATQLDPALRYQSAAEILSEIE